MEALGIWHDSHEGMTRNGRSPNHHELRVGCHLFVGFDCFIHLPCAGIISDMFSTHPQPHSRPHTPGTPFSWKLIYASVDSEGKPAKCADKPSAVEHISYVSEHYRISHTDSGVLKVYKRLEDKKAAAKKRAAAAARSAQKNLEDDTATTGLISSGGARGGAVARKSASKQALSKSAGAAAKQPLRKRMFFGWRR